MGWIVLLLVIVIFVLGAIIVVYYDTYGLPPQAEGIWDTSPVPGVDCASGSRTTNTAGTPLPPCPTATPVTTAAKQKAYDSGYADGADANCEVGKKLIAGQTSPQSFEREVENRRARGLDRYDSSILRAEYDRGWKDGELFVGGQLWVTGQLRC